MSETTVNENQGRQKWLSFTFVICSFVVQIMTLSFGAELYWMTDLKTFILGVILGSALMCLLLCISGGIGLKMRIPTAQLFGNIFGQNGARVMNLILLPAGVIWVSWMSEIAATSVQEIFPAVPGWIVVVAVVALSVFSAIRGVKGMEQSGYIQAPLVLVLVIATVVMILVKGFSHGTLELQTNAQQGGLNLVDSMIFVVLTWISVLPIYSDFTAYVRGKKDVAVGTALSFGVCNALMMLAGGVFAMVSGPVFNMMDGFTAVGIPSVVVLLLVLLCTWTFNDRSFYSFGLAANIVAGSKVPNWVCLVVGGIGAAAIAIGGLMNSLWSVLNLLGCVYGPLLGVYLCRYYLLGGMKECTSDFSKMMKFDWLPFVPWAVGLALGLILKSNQTIISFAVSFVMYYIMYQLRRKILK